MSKAIDFIQGALFLVGVHSEIKPVSPEMLNESFDRLGGFLKGLRDEGFSDVGFVIPGTLTSDMGERGGSTPLLEAMFAVFISPYFAVPVTTEMMRVDAKAREKLNRFYSTPFVPSIRNYTARTSGEGNRRFRFGYRSPGIDKL